MAPKLSGEFGVRLPNTRIRAISIASVNGGQVGRMFHLWQNKADIDERRAHQSMRGVALATRNVGQVYAEALQPMADSP